MEGLDSLEWQGGNGGDWKHLNSTTSQPSADPSKDLNIL